MTWQKAQPAAALIRHALKIFCIEGDRVLPRAKINSERVWVRTGARIGDFFQKEELVENLVQAFPVDHGTSGFFARLLIKHFLNVWSSSAINMQSVLMFGVKVAGRCSRGDRL
jgi:hypothetical protein